MTQEVNIFCDGGSRGNPGPAASAFVVLDGSDKPIAKHGKYLGITTNNQAEYHAVLMAFHFLRKYIEEHPLKEVNFFLDSELVTYQLQGKFRIKNKNLLPIATKIKEIERLLLVTVRYIAIPRSKNKMADALVNYVLDQKVKKNR